MTTLNIDVAERMRSLLARYLVAFEKLSALRESRPHTVTVDTCYAALRLQQRLRWPEGAQLVDDLGRCAQDVLHAWEQSGHVSGRASAALERHVDAAHRLDEALALHLMQVAT